MKISFLPCCLAAAFCLAACAPAPSPRAGDFRPILTLDAAAPGDPAFVRSIDAHGAIRIYHHTFDTAPQAEWSDKSIAKTPKGNRPYLGDFPSRKPVTLALTNLPPHDLVRITFDLFLFNGWNGSSPYWGFSRWDLDLADGRNLLHTSFGNCAEDGDRLNLGCPHNEQAFPDTYPIRIHPAFTGAAERGTLRDGADDQSSVYHFVLTFPHSDKDITFGFHSVIQEGNNRLWGLANVSVETLPAPPLHTEFEIAQLWKTLGDVDAAKAFAAQWELAMAGDQAVDYISRHLEETLEIPADKINALLEDLESADEQHVSGRLDQIAHHGAAALRPLRDALGQDGATADDKARLNAAFYICKRQNANATQLRLCRAAQLLEIIHTKAALALKLTIPEPAPRGVDAPNPTP